MDLLDRLLKHDCWTTRELLLRSQPLSDQQLDADHGIGHGSLRATFVHVIRNMEIWSYLMSGLPQRKSRQSGVSVADLIVRLEIAAEGFATVAYDVAKRNAWDETWIDPTDNVSKSFGGCIAHLITHSMHHRAQILYMFRKSGVNDLPEGDMLSWEKQYLSNANEHVRDSP